MIAGVAHSDTRRAAARSIWEAWTSEHPLPAIAADTRPADLGEGYAIQRQLDELAGRHRGVGSGSYTAVSCFRRQLR